MTLATDSRRVVDLRDALCESSRRKGIFKEGREFVFVMEFHTEEALRVRAVKKMRTHKKSKLDE